MSVNVGDVRSVDRDGTPASTAIYKRPVGGRVSVSGVRIAGDAQADLSVHGGPDRVAYAYASEDAQWWEDRLGRSVDPGSFGENLTTAGVDVTGALIGERWRVGSALLEVAQPREPCWKLGMRMGDPAFPKQFRAAGRPGAYLRLVESGEIAAGDPVEIVEIPEASLSIAEVARIHGRERDRSAELLDLEALSDDWKVWAREREQI